MRFKEIAETKKYKVCWGPHQHAAIGSHVVDASSEQEAKRLVRKILNDTYGKLGWQQWRILYAVPITSKLDESVPRTLYHGTLKKFVPTIMKFGLLPSVGEFTKRMYQEYIDAGIDLEPAVFAADKKSLRKCISAIIGYMRQHNIKLTHQNFYNNAALIVIKHGEKYMHQVGNDWKGFSKDPQQGEVGDWYSYDTISPTTVLMDDKLRNFLRRNDVFLDQLGIDDTKPREAENQRLIKSFQKKIN